MGVVTVLNGFVNATLTQAGSVEDWRAEVQEGKRFASIVSKVAFVWGVVILYGAIFFQSFGFALLASFPFCLAYDLHKGSQKLNEYLVNPQLIESLRNVADREKQIEQHLYQGLTFLAWIHRYNKYVAESRNRRARLQLPPLYD